MRRRSGTNFCGFFVFAICSLFASLIRPLNIYYMHFLLSLLHNLWQISLHSLVRHVLTLFNIGRSSSTEHLCYECRFFSPPKLSSSCHMWYPKHFSFCAAIFSPFLHHRCGSTMKRTKKKNKHKSGNGKLCHTQRDPRSALHLQCEMSFSFLIFLSIAPPLSHFYLLLFIYLSFIVIYC